MHRGRGLGHWPQLYRHGPLANGATTLLFEGVPNYPDITRVSKIIDKHKVNILTPHQPPSAP